MYVIRDQRDGKITLERGNYGWTGWGETIMEAQLKKERGRTQGGKWGEGRLKLRTI